MRICVFFVNTLFQKYFILTDKYKETVSNTEEKLNLSKIPEQYTITSAPVTSRWMNNWSQRIHNNANNVLEN